jgi:SAM-dependent methyltransferase
LKKEDILLDIGTGSGFFPSRFFSSKVKYIDAIDIEKSAIDYAKKYNYANNINFTHQDAVSTAFPKKKYNVIVWDGAIGHFHLEAINEMLNKILHSLDKNGIFIGSESLGSNEGIDHLQFFENLNDLGILLKKYFRYVYLKELQYPIGSDLTFKRREGYWRCCNSEIANTRFIGDWNKI